MGHENLLKHLIQWHMSEDSWKDPFESDRNAMLIKEGDF